MHPDWRFTSLRLFTIQDSWIGCLYNWLQEKEIKQTQLRPYYKNDQAYVEQEITLI